MEGGWREQDCQEQQGARQLVHGLEMECVRLGEEEKEKASGGFMNVY